MYNPIEEKRRFVQAQIQKSFDSGINIADEIELEKAHKDGDHHPTKPWVWVSSANGGKGDWRVEGGRAHKKAGASIADAGTGKKVVGAYTSTIKANKISSTQEENTVTSKDFAKNKNAITELLKNCDSKTGMDGTMKYHIALFAEGKDRSSSWMSKSAIESYLRNYNDAKATAYRYGIKSGETPTADEFEKKYMEYYRQKNPNSITTNSEILEEAAEIYKQKYGGSAKNQTSTPAPRKPGSTDEIERMTAAGVRSSILGLNNIATNVKDNGDHFKIDFDVNDFNTNGKRSPQIDRIAKFLESMGASCVIGSNSIKAYKKVEAKKNTTSKTQSPQDKVKDIMQQFDDTTMDEDEFDEYVNSVIGNDMGQKLRKEILNGNKSFSDKKQAYKDAVERHLGLKPQKYSDMDIKDAKKALVGKVVTLKDYWPDGRGGSQDAIGEIKNVRLYGKDKLPIAEISYPNGDEQLIRLDEIDDGKMKDSYKTHITIGNDRTKLDAIKKKRYNLNPDGTPVDLSKIENNNLKFSIALVKTNIKDLKNKLSQTSKTALVARKRLNAQIEDQEGKLSEMEEEMNKRANSKSDPRDKIAQDAGFKDYEEMKGYQDYVTQKNLLKKRSTSSGMRLLYQREVDKYEKNHADLIKKMAKSK